ncbi:hypothetical protein ACLBWJ_09995 [Microbacterium sp. M4A5_1d]
MHSNDRLGSGMGSDSDVDALAQLVADGRERFGCCAVDADP